MKHSNLLVGIAMMACVSLIECKSSSQSNVVKVDPVFEEVVLKIGNHEVTRYEFEKNYKIFQSMYRQQHRTTPDSIATKSWISEFIDKQYLLADAYAKGYDKDKFVVERTQSMTRLMISQPKGLLYQELVSKLGNDNFTIQDKQKAQKTKLEEEQKILMQHNEEVMKASEQKINGIILYKLANDLKQYNDVHHFNKDEFKTMLNDILISYQFNGDKRNVTVAQFMDYYNMLPAKYPIENAETIRYYLEGMVVDDYDYQEAEKLGITKKPEFILNKRNYANSLISNRYEKVELNYDTIITPNEFKTLYNKEKKKYIVPVKLVASLYYYTNRKDAFNALVAFSRRNNTPSIPPVTAKFADKHTIITVNTAIADTIKNALYSLRIGQVSRPIPVDNGYAVAIKESESGQRLKLQKELEPLFTQQIRNERLRLRKEQVIMSLKKKYKLQDHINYKNYL